MVNKIVFFVVFFIILQSVKCQTYLQYLPEDSNFNYNRALVYGLNVVQDTLCIGAGALDTCDGIFTNHLAQWDGQNFHAMRNGDTDWGVVYDATSYRDTVYLCGNFESLDSVPHTGAIAAWANGQFHSILIYDSAHNVPTFYSAITYHDTLFVGNNVLGLASDPNNVFLSVAGYRNGEWFHVGGLQNNCFDLAVYNDELYACSYHGLQKYSGETGNTQWQDVCLANSYTYNMVVDTINNFLYFAGDFNMAMGASSSYAVNTDYVARWNGFYLEGIGPGTLDTNYCGIGTIGFYRGYLFMSLGWSGIIHNQDIGTLIFWDGQQWQPAVPYPYVKGIGFNKLVVYKDTLYAGGEATDTVIIGNDSIIYDDPSGYETGVKGLIRFYMPPDTTCHWLQPRVLAHADTFYLPQGGGTVDVPLYNNNAYADSWQWDFDDGSTDTVKDPLHTYSQTGTYQVQVTVTEDGCTKTAEKDIVIMEATGIANLSLKNLSFKIYPNPTKQDFTVEISLPENIKGKNEFFVTGMGGANKYRRHLQAGFNRFVVSTTGWQPTTYICNLMAGNKFVGSKKLVLTK